MLYSILKHVLLTSALSSFTPCRKSQPLLMSPTVSSYTPGQQTALCAHGAQQLGRCAWTSMHLTWCLDHAMRVCHATAWSVPLFCAFSRPLNSCTMFVSFTCRHLLFEHFNTVHQLCRRWGGGRQHPSGWRLPLCGIPQEPGWVHQVLEHVSQQGAHYITWASGAPQHNPLLSYNLIVLHMGCHAMAAA